jgi:formylglycine-generating enzyme required for sulfatase activity
MAKPTLKPFAYDVVTVNAQGQEIDRSRRYGEFLTDALGNSVGLEMVSIPGGSFLMGSPETELYMTVRHLDSEGPQHPVIVQPFFMGKYLVTQAQWRAVAALPKINHDLELYPSYCQGAMRPVNRVSWFESVEFCERLSAHTGLEYRLPSEAEWEYACRAGTTTPFHFGETITSDLVNYDGTLDPYPYASALKGIYRGCTTDVGSFPPNAFGLYDMHGNAFEWCLDHWHENYQDAPHDGSAWVVGGYVDRRSFRGGSCDYDAWNCRSAFRGRMCPNKRNWNVGLRVVCRVVSILASCG